MTAQIATDKIRLDPSAINQILKISISIECRQLLAVYEYRCALQNFQSSSLKMANFKQRVQMIAYE